MDQNNIVELDWIRLINHDTIPYLSVNKTDWRDFVSNPDNSRLRWLEFQPRKRNETPYCIKTTSIIGFKLKD